MAFTLFSPLFHKIDVVTASFVNDISTRAIADATPVVSIGLVITIALYGFLVTRGVIQMPIIDLVAKLLRISVISSIAMAGGLYQTELSHFVTTLPDDIARTLLSNASESDSAASIIDLAASKGFDAAGLAFEKGGFFSSDGLVYGLFGLLIMIVTAIMTATGGSFILVSKVTLALLAGIGPYFIFALLFKPTEQFFEKWIGQVCNYGITIVLFTAVFGFMMDIFTGYMSDLRFDGAQNVSYALGGATILGIVCIVILFQLPQMASGLAGGVGISYMSELKGLSRGASRTTKAGTAAASAAGKGASVAAKQTANLAKKAGSYFKGKVA